MSAKKMPNVERRLSTDPRRCPACRGTGKNGRDQACTTCGGSGGVAAPAAVHRPGELVTGSGVYEVHHGATHAGEPEQALQQGAIFPRCDVCGLDVSYRLKRSTPDLVDEAEFKAEEKRP